MGVAYKTEHFCPSRDFARQASSQTMCGGFRLTKWSSSSRNVLFQIPNQEMASLSINLDLDDLPIEHSLGLLWNTETDSFRFAVTSCQSALSKCGVRSQVSSVFDPLGVLVSFPLPVKCLIQTVWCKKKGWDEPLDEDDQIEWENWLASLSSLKVFELPRCLCSDAPRDAKVEGLNGVNCLAYNDVFLVS